MSAELEGEVAAVNTDRRLSDLEVELRRLRSYIEHDIPLIQSFVLHRTSIDNSNPFTWTVTIDHNFRQVLEAKLRFYIRPVRSNVTTSASGGSSTPTSSGGSSHTHSFSGGTVGSEQSHTHAVVTTSTNNSAGHTHDYSSAPPATTGDNSVAHTHNISATSSTSGAAHSHSFSGGTNASETSHTHTVTISAHTHSMTYGIFVDTTPTTPAVRVTVNGTLDGTTFNTVNSEIELDVTSYLRATGSYNVLQAANTLAFSCGAGKLVDIEGQLNCMMTRANVAPIPA